MFFCEWVRPVWMGMQIQLIPRREDVSSLHNWFFQKTKEQQHSKEVRRFIICSISCTLWAIWKARNVFYFENKNLNPMATVIQANFLISEYMDFVQKGFNQQNHRVMPFCKRKDWRPPINDIIKINTDASFDKDKGAACASIIARNKYGHVEFGITKKFDACSPLVAEALVLREATAIATNFGIKKFILENDNLDLIRTCRGEISRGEIISIIGDIHELKRKADWCNFTWVAREGNEVAHHIAQLAARGALPLHWRWHQPLSLELLIQKDRDNIKRN